MSKRKLSDDVIIHHGKKIRLDSFFQDLSLEETDYYKPVDVNSKFEINPSIKTFGFSHETKDDLGYLAEKLMQGYVNTVQRDFKMIKYYHIGKILYYHLQRWIVRMFNSFALQYNEVRATKMPKFKTFSKMMKFIEANGVLFQNLLSLAIEQNRIELRNLETWAKNKKIQELDYTELKYDYWDKIKPEDLVMSDGDSVSDDGDIQMDIDVDDNGGGNDDGDAMMT